ncbi:MAG: hypothetical protein EAZ99_02025 [Alphaproteobacteria bacterium]|nr:MAG: hypothetical protein EAZ99_02025 [Alphaproteobacteria bacterium]
MLKGFVHAGFAGGLVAAALISAAVTPAVAQTPPLGQRAGVMVDPGALPADTPLARRLTPSLPPPGVATSPALRQGWTRPPGGLGGPQVAGGGVDFLRSGPQAAPGGMPQSQFLAARPQGEPTALAPATSSAAGLGVPSASTAPVSAPRADGGMVALAPSAAAGAGPVAPPPASQPDTSDLPPGLIRQSFPRPVSGEPPPMPPRRGLEVPSGQRTLPPPSSEPPPLPPLPAAPAPLAVAQAPAAIAPPQPARGGVLDLPPLPPMPSAMPQSAVPAPRPAGPPAAAAPAPAAAPPAPAAAPPAPRPAPQAAAPAPQPAPAPAPPRPAPPQAAAPRPAPPPPVVASLPSQRLGGGEVVRLPFAAQDTSVSPAAQRVLAPVIERMRADPDLRVIVRGFAAAQPDQPAMARRLGLSRAMEVRNAFAAAGIAAQRAVVQAPPPVEGDSQPDRVEIELP